MTSDQILPRGLGAVRYSTGAIILHWLIAALLIFQVGLGLRMDDLEGPAKFAAVQLHKSVGITILLLVALRLVWRFYRKPPPIAANGWEKPLAHLVHILLYLLLFALPISGWVMISASRIAVPTLLFGVIPWPHVPGLAEMAPAAKHAWHEAAEFIHGNLVNLLYLLFALHVAGALKHHFIDRKGGIAPMAPGATPGRAGEPRLIAIILGVVLAAGLGLSWLPIGARADTPAPAAAPTAAEAQPPAPAPSASASPAPADTTAADATDAAPKDVPNWAIASGSSLRFRTTWSGEAIAGGFNRFDGTIAFDPDRLDQSHVDIRIDLATVFSGDVQRDDTLKSEDWFSVGKYAAARFKADKFRKTGADRYVATGTLAMKGVTLPISVPFTLTVTGDKAVMRGTASVDRTAYKIGEGEFSATTDIPAAVKIDIAVNARRK